MSFVEHILLAFSVLVSAFYLVAGGYVAIRQWIRNRAAAKAEAFAAKVKAAVASAS